MVNGTIFDFQNLEANTYDPKDMAHALSNICRFGGHCKRFYSVAEHCVRMVQLYGTGNPDHDLALLMHDCAETYIGDVPSPIKMQWHRDVETAILELLHVTITDEIKQADLRMLCIEVEALMRPWKEWTALFSRIALTEREESVVTSLRDVNLEMNHYYWRDRWLDEYNRLKDMCRKCGHDKTDCQCHVYR